MTVSSTVRTAGPYIGTGAISAYPFAYKVFEDSDVVVQTTDTFGGLSTLTLDSDYTVARNSDQNASPGGTVNLSVPLPTGVRLELGSDVPLLQLTHITDAGGFFPKIIEDSLDAAVIMAQQAADAIQGTLRVPEIDGIPALPARALRINTVVGFDANGDRALVPMALGLPVTPTRGFVDATQVGAKGDGSHLDSPAIQAAINYLSGAGGGTVFLPQGTYLVSAPGVFEAIQLLSNVTLRGAGKGLTILKLVDGANDDVINMPAVSNVAILDMTIDGNRTNQTMGVHGIRSAGVDGLRIENVCVQNTNSYGIGLEVGTQRNIRIVDLDVLNTTDDGIDFKNPNGDNDLIVLDRVNITNFGLGGLPTQTGIDIRGIASLSNINVRGVKPGNTGIRFRNSGTEGAGIGGHRSSLVNFKVFADNDSGSSKGVEVVAEDVQVSNGYINSTSYGVYTQNRHTEVTNVICENVDIGFYIGTGIDDFSVELRADHASFLNCHHRRTATGGGTYAFFIDSGGVLGANVGDGCSVMNVNTGVFVNAASQAFVHDCDLTGATNPVSDGGLPNTNSRYRNVVGFATESNVATSGLPVDSTGRKQFTVNHGLAIQPRVEDITLTILANSVVADPRYGGLVIDSVTPTQINGSLYVTVASATGGAIAQVGLRSCTRAF